MSPCPVTAIIRHLARPLTPEPTGEVPVLPRMEGIRAVLFDVYGTLFISGCGEVGTATATGRERAFDVAAALCGLVGPPGGTEFVTRLDESIAASHAESRRNGVEYPEVDILREWAATFSDLAGSVPEEATLRRLATVYENLVNPVWPMPGCRETLEGLRDAGFLLGLVSNAQFYTPPLFEALLKTSRESLGIIEGLEFYSYRFGHAKPGLELYRLAAGTLEQSGIAPQETLFVGNDLLNDIAGARRAGFRTALFAGDGRSLRKRDGDPRVAGITADAVITELVQLRTVLEEGAPDGTL